MADTIESTSSGRMFLIPLDVILKARKDGVSLEKLQEAVRMSARCTHESGNRRYKDLVFMVVGKRVVNYTMVGEDVVVDQRVTPPPPPEKHYRCDTCHDTKRVQVFDQCGYCDGLGCNNCDQGLTPSSIPCPTCEQRARLQKY